MGGANSNYFTLPKGVAKPAPQQTVLTSKPKKEAKQELGGDDEVKVEEPQDEVMVDVDAEDALAKKELASEKTSKKADGTSKKTGMFASLVVG